MSKGGSKGEMCGMHPPTSHNFSITLNLFDNKNPYNYSKHRSKCATKLHHFGEELKIRGKKFRQKFFLKIVQNALKWLFTLPNFFLNFRGSIPPTSRSCFCLSICLEVTVPKKLSKCAPLPPPPPPPENNSECATFT